VAGSSRTASFWRSNRRFKAMRGLVLMVAGLCGLAQQAHGSLNRIPYRDTCKANAQDECMDLRKFWKSPAECSSIYGGFKANENNMHNMVKYHLEDSFKFLLMASHWNRDDVNRVGLHKTLMGYSDQLWDNAVKMIKYMSKRGGKFDSHISTFELKSVRPSDFDGEVEVLAMSLDMWKRQAMDVKDRIKQAMMKHNDTNFDPSIFGFFQENYMEKYTENIRSLAGYLNIMGKMAKDEKTKKMGLHLFDRSL